MRALAGDASDNIPGVPGIGEKTALKLIARYHSLENLLAHLEEIKEKALKDRLQENAEQARLSRQLSELEAQVPLIADLEALAPGPPDREALRQLFVELEFSKLAKELQFDSRPKGPVLWSRTRGAGKNGPGHPGCGLHGPGLRHERAASDFGRGPFTPCRPWPTPGECPPTPPTG